MIKSIKEALRASKEKLTIEPSEACQTLEDNLGYGAYLRGDSKVC